LMASTLSDNVNTLRDIFMTEWQNNVVFLYLKPSILHTCCELTCYTCSGHLN
jgi:hypothetical protein